MRLSNPSIAYLSEALNTSGLTHKYLNKVCLKIDVPIELSHDEEKGNSLDNRLWALIENLNGGKKLNLLVSVIVKEYSIPKNVDEINTALKMSGYEVDRNGNIKSSMAEQVQFGEIQSKIESDLTKLGLSRVLHQMNNGIKEYGEGREFPSLRNAIEGLVEEILTAEGVSTTGSIRNKMERLHQFNILSTAPRQLRVNGQTIHLELAHSYGIYSLLSHYLNHYNELSEEELHFVFFQSIGLIWLLTQRYLKYLETKV